MKKRKPRTALHRRTNQVLASFGKVCQWWDDGCPECMLPWSHSGLGGCNGNPFVCKKLWYRHISSAKKLNKIAVIDFEQRGRIESS